LNYRGILLSKREERDLLLAILGAKVANYQRLTDSLRYLCTKVIRD